MSEAFLFRRGGGSSGGSGGGNAYAVIGVSYPDGSTCTCSNGSKTLHTKDTSGSFLFMIPEAGTWTVTATDGTNTSSKAVSITTQWQSESVTLDFRIYIIRDGVIQMPLYKDAETTIVERAGYADLYTNGNTAILVRTDTAIDITAFDTLVLEIYDSEGGSYAVLDTCPALGVGKSAPTINATTTAVTGFDAYKKLDVDNETILQGVNELDISSLSGAYYLAMSVSGTKRFDGNLRIANLYVRG